MTRLSIQWAVILVATGVVTVAAARYYDRHLTTVTPEVIAGGTAGSDVLRVQGLVAPGTLEGDPASGRVAFHLQGAQTELRVHYDGLPPENLRELKTLVVVGRWDSAADVLLAHDLALVTNYGFIVGAYLAGFLPLALYLFVMEHRVQRLYAEIKHTKLYEPEST